MWFDVTIPARKMPTDVYTWLACRTSNFAYGIEKAPTTGMMHYQCKVNVPVAPEDSHVVRQLFAPFHVEVSRSEYKDYVYKDGCYFDTDMEATGIALNPVQETIVQAWNDCTEREVFCVVDTTGCSGKTYLSRHLECLGIAVRVPQMPRDKIMGFLMSQPKYGRYIFDLTRVDGKKDIDILMSAVEELKNGEIADWRYHGSRFRYPFGKNIQVMIMCNKEPEHYLLSKDRWAVIYI